VAATYVVLGFLETRQDREDAARANEPVPVRVNAAGWDGQQDFTRWLIVRLGDDYRLRPNVAREMVKRGLILPVIDGLDEMDTDSAGPRARALLDRLNRAPWRDRPVVVMCRTTEFAELTQLRGDNGLHGGTTLTLQPLATGTVSEYLSAHQDETGTGHPGWTQVITHITDHPDGALATCMRNPWMLGLTATALHHTPSYRRPTDLLPPKQPSATCCSLLRSSPRSPPRTKANHTATTPKPTSKKWMRSLARCLQRRRDDGRNGTAIRLDEIWEIAGTGRIRILHGLTFGLLVGLVFKFLFDLGLSYTSLLTDVVGFVVGLTVGSMLGLIRFPRPQRMAWNVTGPSRWRRGLKAGIVVGAVAVS
jgi:hypothetical protein